MRLWVCCPPKRAMGRVTLLKWRELRLEFEVGVGRDSHLLLPPLVMDICPS